MGYENAAQFDRAAKRSIKNTGKDPGIAYREMLRDRFLLWCIFPSPTLPGKSAYLAWMRRGRDKAAPRKSGRPMRARRRP